MVDQTKYFMNTGYEVLQGINYSDKYGLFIVTTKKLEYFPNGDVQTSGSRVLHIDMSRTKTMKFKDGKKYPVLFRILPLTMNWMNQSSLVLKWNP